MERIKLALFDKDTEYKKAFSKRICCAYENITLDISGKKSSYNSDIIVVNESMIESIDGIEKDKVLILRENHCSDNPAIQTLTSTYKFSSVSTIVTAAYCLYSRIKGLSPESMPDYNSNTTKILSFMGISGGAGTSMISLAVSKELSMTRNKKVLYISLEPIVADSICIDSNRFTSTINELLYLADIDDKKRLKRFICTVLLEDVNGVWRLPPSDGNNPMYDYITEDILQILNCIIGVGDFDYVVIDCGLVDLHRYKELINTSSHMMLISKYDNPKKKKLPIIKKQLVNIIEGDSEEPLIIENMAPTESSEIDESLKIVHDNKAFSCRDNVTDINLHSAFGTGVKELVERII